MKNKIRLIILGMLLSLVWLAPVHAQDQADEGVARTAMITPKDGHEETLLKAITDYHKWVAQFDGHHRYNWYAIRTGKHTGKFAARTGNHNWADFDAEYDWQEEADKVFQTNVAPHIEHVEMYFTEDMDEFSNWPADFEGYTHYSVSNWYVHNGQYGKFQRHLKKIVETLKAGGFPNHWGIMSVESGGYGNQIQIVGANKGWADLSAPDPAFSKIMIAELGSEEAFDAFMEEWGSTFKSGHNWMAEWLPEASDYGTD
jgi:hypothetical protein